MGHNAFFISMLLASSILSAFAHEKPWWNQPAASPRPGHYHHHHSPGQSPSPVPVHPPTYPPIKPPTKPPTLPPVKPPTKPPTYPPIKPPIKPPTLPPVKPPTKPPTYPPIKPPTKPPTYPPVKPPTKPPTYPPVKPPTKPPTYPPVKPPTKPPTYPPVKPPTKPPTYPPVKPPMMPPTYPPVSPPVRQAVAIQGVVLCKSCKYRGNNTLTDAIGLNGATVQLVCNNTRYPLRITTKTNRHGKYYFQPATISTFGVGKCRVSIIKSSKKWCSVPTNINNGITGTLLKPEKVSPKSFALYTAYPLAFEPSPTIKCVK